MQHCQGNFERCLIVFHLLTILPCVVAGKNPQTLLLREQRGDTGGISKQSLMEVEDVIPSTLSGWRGSLGSNLVGSACK